MMSRSRTHAPIRLMSALALSLAVVAGGVWLLTAVYLQPAPEKVAVSDQAKTRVKDINLQGDQTLQGQYLTLATGKQPDQAQKLFDNAVAAEADTGKKSGLLLLNASLALQAQQIEQALAAAEQAVQLRPDVTSYSALAQVYAVKMDTAKQKEYLEKALAAARTSNDPNKASNITGLTAQIDGLNALDKAKERMKR